MKQFPQGSVWRRTVVATHSSVAFLIMTGIAAAQGWQNPTDPFDINNDGVRSVSDFHIIASEVGFTIIGDPGTGALPKNATPPPFVDPSGNNFVNPKDFLQIINELATNPSSFEIGIPDGAVTTPGGVTVGFEFQDIAGTPISQVQVGETFALVAKANNDLSITGISTVYMDVLFDDALVSGPNVFLNPILEVPFALPGTVSATGVDEIGGFVGITGNLEGVELFELQFTALESGVFTVDGANGLAHVLLNFDAFGPDFQSASLAIVPEPSTAVISLIGVLAFGAVRFSR